MTRMADHVVASLQMRYPGERTLATRARHLRDGIDVDQAAWRFAESCAATSA